MRQVKKAMEDQFQSEIVSEEALAPQESTESGEVPTETGAEFEYLQRNEFTSEIYKIEVRNLGYFGIGVSTHSAFVSITVFTKSYSRNSRNY